MHVVESIFGMQETRAFEPFERLDENAVTWLQAEISEGNVVGGMSMQLIERDDKAFGTGKAKKLGFSGVNNYITVIGKNEKDEVYEKAGYYGTFITLMATNLGLAATWSDGSNSKLWTKGFKEGKETKVAAIAVGTPANKSSQEEAAAAINARYAAVAETAPAEATDEFDAATVDWFNRAVAVAMLAPSKDGAHPYKFTLEGYNKEGLPLVRCTPNDATDKDVLLDMGKAEAYFEVASNSAGRKFEWAHETPIKRTAGATYGHRFRSKIAPGEFQI